MELQEAMRGQIIRNNEKTNYEKDCFCVKECLRYWLFVYFFISFLVIIIILFCAQYN